MDNKAFAKAILTDCPNIFSYFQSLPEHPLFLSAVAKAYHEQWFREFERFLILQGHTCSGKSTFSKFLSLLGGTTLDVTLNEFTSAPEAILTGNYNRTTFAEPAMPTAINIYVDGRLSQECLDIIWRLLNQTFISNRPGFDSFIKPPLLILQTQKPLTELRSTTGLLRRQLLLNFQPIARPIHNYLEHQQISYEIPAFLNCLADMTKDDCLQILATADRNLLTAK